MRISTGMIYDSGLASMQNRTGTLLKTQQQLSTGRRVLSPSDDPVAAARALEITQSQSANASQATTRDNVKSTLGILDSQLDSATDLMARVRELTVQAGNAALSAADRRSIATELRARFEEMVGLANSRDGAGQYLFGGYQTNGQPFAGSVENGVVYGGDDGARTLRVSGSRELPISDSGNDVFMRIKNGNGVFATGVQYEKSANVHSVGIDAGTIADATKWASAPAKLEVRFWADSTGVVPTAGRTTASVVPALPLVVAAGTADQFTVDVDAPGVPPTATLLPGTYSTPTELVAGVQAAIDAALGFSPPAAGAAVVSLGVGNRLVVTSATTGAASQVALGAGGGARDALASLFGTPVALPGTAGVPGTMFYDLVDTATGNSAFTGLPPATGAGGSFTHPYLSNAPITLQSYGPPAFDYGAAVTVTGNPATGDKFTLDHVGGGLKTSPSSISHVNAMIDRGSVSDPARWASSANGQDMEVRFWVDTQGTVTTRGQAVGNAVIASATVVANTADQFSIDVDGAGPRTVTVAAGTYATPADVVVAVQAGINALAAPPVTATVSLDAANRLVVTSGASGSTSSVVLAAGAGARDGLSRFFGAPVSTAGITGAAGATYYDLVDATTGKSLFTGGASTTGGAGNTFTRGYVSGANIGFSGNGGPGQVAFDFGAAVVVSGNPVSGDTFTIEGSTDPARSNGYFVTEAKTVTQVNTGSGIIGAGEVLDPAKWNSPLNSRNLETRFWQDPVSKTLYYDLVDKETEKSLFTDTISTANGSNNTFTHAFKAGDSIKFSGLHANYGNSGGAGDFGISVTIQGTPASGDAFKIQPSESESVFETLGRLITGLESGAPVGTSGNTHLANELGSVLTSIGQVEENLLRVRASVGSRLAEVDDLDAVGDNLDLQYSETLSRLQDLDYAEAITHLTRQQMELQAAQQSFAKISQLSLFQYL